MGSLRKVEIEGETKETTSIVACGGEWQGRRVTSHGGFVAVNGVAIDEWEQLTNLVLLCLGLIDNDGVNM